ncbi:MAG TPA: hypothetical protein VF509_06090 [Sphingobium sp.]
MRNADPREGEYGNVSIAHINGDINSRKAVRTSGAACETRSHIMIILLTGLIASALAAWTRRDRSSDTPQA